MLLIMSSAYIDQELKSEFGEIPPCFLPLGNKRLYQHQLGSFSDISHKFISIPEDYIIPKHDMDFFNSSKVEIIRTPRGLSLGMALSATLTLIDEPLEHPLNILFGDTLVLDIPEHNNDVVAIANTEEVYEWAKLSTNKEKLIEQNCLVDDGSDIIVGYFKINTPRLLLKMLTKSNWDFYEGINLYNQKTQVTPIKVTKWLDFGHVNSFYHSKVNFTTQRSFNNLIITTDYVEKSSFKEHKIAAEASWFDEVPKHIRGFLPQLIDVSFEPSSYRLEYLHNTALNELWVFAEISHFTWKKIFKSCFDFIETCRDTRPTSSVKYDSIIQLFTEKTLSRLHALPTSKFDINTPIRINGGSGISMIELARSTEKHLPTLDVITLLHGDFCFSNILYDFRTQKIKTIDPRGHTLDGNKTIWGESRYDIAKLSHSVIGMYDYIVAGYFTLTKTTVDRYDFQILDNNKHCVNQSYFVQKITQYFDVSYIELLAMQIHLFLSMLPLHADNLERQYGLLANAYRLHKLLEEEIK